MLLVVACCCVLLLDPCWVLRNSVEGVEHLYNHLIAHGVRPHDMDRLVSHYHPISPHRTQTNYSLNRFVLKSTESWMSLSSYEDGSISSESIELFQSRCKDSQGQSGCLYFPYREVGARILEPEHDGLQMFSGTRCKATTRTIYE